MGHVFGKMNSGTSPVAFLGTTRLSDVPPSDRTSVSHFRLRARHSNWHYLLRDRDGDDH